MVPVTLNGYPVVRSETYENGYSTVMMKRGENDFIVATWWPDLKDHWEWGHYDLSETDRHTRFVGVARRNMER